MITQEFLQHVSNYMTGNGFKSDESKEASNILCFYKYPSAIMLHDDKLEVFKKDGFFPMVKTHEFTGISNISFNSFIMLLHITGVISLQEFKMNASKLLALEVLEGESFIEQRKMAANETL